MVFSFFFEKYVSYIILLILEDKRMKNTKLVIYYMLIKNNYISIKKM